MDERKRQPAELDGALFVDDAEEFDANANASGGRSGAAGDGKAESAAELVSQILRYMSIDARVTVREDDARVVLDVHGPDAGRAIGKKGATLDAMQFLANKILNRASHGRRHIIVDSGDYRERHDNGLISLARREAKRAVQIGRVITLEPMPPRDRRVIHVSLSKFPGVSTKSDGEGADRRIQIIPENLQRRPDNRNSESRGPRRPRSEP